MKVVWWRAKKWEKADWRCRLLGHAWDAGWWGDLPYYDQERGVIDGIGRQHITLYCRCDRCGDRRPVGYIHEGAAR